MSFPQSSGGTDTHDDEGAETSESKTDLASIINLNTRSNNAQVHSLKY